MTTKTEGVKAGHTKGPWSVGSDDQATSQINIMGDGFYVAGAIAGFDREIQEANARLIAAAPDLLEGGDLLARTLNCAPRDLIAKTFGTDALDGLDALTAALAKAQGPSNG